MSKYSDLDVMIDVYDPKTYIDGCKCDPDVNYTCELCMTYNTLREAKRMLLLRDTEIERLRAIINAKLHQRKCHDCGHVGWYADSRTPYCLCDRCRSQDTRLVKEEK